MVQRKGFVVNHQIMAPVSRLSEVTPLVDAGVDEIYCGVFSERWWQAYSNVASPNRIDRRIGNLNGYEELKQVARAAKSSGVKLNFTLNGLYSAAQYRFLEQELELLQEIDVDALIVADLGLLVYLKKNHWKKAIHASTGFTAFNTEILTFLSEMGVTRVILPRAMSEQEIASLMQRHPSMEFELFILNGRCRNIDGFCTFQHGINDLESSHFNAFLIHSKTGHFMQNCFHRLPLFIQKGAMQLVGANVCSTACALDYELSRGADTVPPLRNPYYIHELFSCGGCRVRQFVRLGVSAFKIVGRTFPIRKKVNDVRFIRALIDKASDNGLDSESFEEYARDQYQAVYGRSCPENCYY